MSDGSPDPPKNDGDEKPAETEAPTQPSDDPIAADLPPDASVQDVAAVESPSVEGPPIAEPEPTPSVDKPPPPLEPIPFDDKPPPPPEPTPPVEEPPPPPEPTPSTIEEPPPPPEPTPSAILIQHRGRSQTKMSIRDLNLKAEKPPPPPKPTPPVEESSPPPEPTPPVEEPSPPPEPTPPVEEPPPPPETTSPVKEPTPPADEPPPPPEPNTPTEEPSQPPESTTPTEDPLSTPEPPAAESVPVIKVFPEDAPPGENADGRELLVDFVEESENTKSEFEGPPEGTEVEDTEEITITEGLPEETEVEETEEITITEGLPEETEVEETEEITEGLPEETKVEETEENTGWMKENEKDWVLEKMNRNDGQNDSSGRPGGCDGTNPSRTGGWVLEKMYGNACPTKKKESSTSTKEETAATNSGPFHQYASDPWILEKMYRNKGQDKLSRRASKCNNATNPSRTGGWVLEKMYRTPCPAEEKKSSTSAKEPEEAMAAINSAALLQYENEQWLLEKMYRTSKLEMAPTVQSTIKEETPCDIDTKKVCSIARKLLVAYDSVTACDMIGRLPTDQPEEMDDTRNFLEWVWDSFFGWTEVFKPKSNTKALEEPIVDDKTQNCV